MDNKFGYAVDFVHFGEIELRDTEWRERESVTLLKHFQADVFGRMFSTYNIMNDIMVRCWRHEGGIEIYGYFEKRNNGHLN